jgi:hypothetical protein
LIVSYYPFSFAMYSWKKKNKAASIGVMLLTVISVILSGARLFIK